MNTNTKRTEAANAAFRGLVALCAAEKRARFKIQPWREGNRAGLRWQDGREESIEFSAATQIAAIGKAHAWVCDNL